MSSIADLALEIQKAYGDRTGGTWLSASEAVRLATLWWRDPEIVGLQELARGAVLSVTT